MDIVIKNARLWDYTDGLVVIKAPKNPDAPIDAGISISGDDRGFNWFELFRMLDDEEVIRAIVAESSACDTVMARGNFFGTNAGTIEGKVDATGTLGSSTGLSIQVDTEPAPKANGFVRLIRAFPNPTSGGVRLILEAPVEHASVEIVILDVSGRLVRRLERVGLSVGTNQIEWDGRDQRSSRASNGIYFVRAEHEGRSVGTLRIVVAR
jgi:hypothetical protein